MRTELCAIASALGLAIAACAGTLADRDRFAQDGGVDSSEGAAAPATDGSTAACPDVPSAVFGPACGSCHGGAAPTSGLDLVSPDLAARLVGKTALGGPGLLLDPNVPEESLVYTKLGPTPPFGQRMPATPLDDATTACVLEWVKGAAKPEGRSEAGAPTGELLWLDQDITVTTAAYPPLPDKAPPDNWYAPVDYYDGKIEIRVDVTAKPDATPVWLELCMWQGALGSANFTCIHCVDPPFTATGTYTCETTASAGFNAASADFHKPFAVFQHRAKDGAHTGPDLATENKGLPIAAHYTAVLVPQGASFSGWAAYPR